MPPYIDLEPFRNDITTRLLVLKETHDGIRAWLHHEHGVDIEKNTLKRRLKIWKVSRRSQSPRTPELVELVRAQFQQTVDSDAVIAETLTAQGHATTTSQVKEIRLQHGWRRRAANDEQAVTQLYAAIDATKELLDEGTARSWGYRFIKTDLREHKGIRVTEDDARVALRFLQPEASRRRRPGMKSKRRGEYIVPGPNFLWAVDGHDKFRNYGIEIYAAVDAYSRRVMWIYIGNSNRTQVSVCLSYLRAIQQLKVCPCFIRSDHGNETMMMATAHVELYEEACRQEGDWTEEELLSIHLRDCYMYGTSTANIRIENWWLRLINSQTKPWLDYFKWLVDSSLYNSSNMPDRVIFLFVFVPIIRREIHRFVHNHNEHAIRRQRNRPNHVPGVPNSLYKEEEEEGFTPSMQQVGHLMTNFEGFGRLNFRISGYLFDRLFLRLTALDPDAVITEESKQWCKQVMQDLGHPEDPQANEFIVDSQYLVCPQWYRGLREMARLHYSRRDLPYLKLTTKPTDPENWRIRAEVIAEATGDVVDTFGLVEGGVVGVD